MLILMLLMIGFFDGAADDLEVALTTLGGGGGMDELGKVRVKQIKEKGV